MSIQPGVGYTFKGSSLGHTLDIQEKWTPWTYDLYPSWDNHPFKVNNQGYADATTDYRFEVVPGTVNNLTPMIDGTSDLMTDDPNYWYKWNFNSTSGYSWVVLQVSFDSSTKAYPDPNTSHVSAVPSYPVVASLSYNPTSDDDTSYIILATAYQDPSTATGTDKTITVWQAVTGSLWTDRIKVHGIDAKYFWARI